MHWFSLGWKKWCLFYFTLLFWNKKWGGSLSKTDLSNFIWRLKFGCVWVFIKKIKLRLAGTYLEMEKQSGQVTGRKRERLLPRRCRRLNKFWDHRSCSGLFLWFFRLFLCRRQIRNKDKSAKWRLRVYWSRKISHSHHFPVCCERQNHSQQWIVAA